MFPEMENLTEKRLPLNAHTRLEAAHALPGAWLFVALSQATPSVT